MEYKSNPVRLIKAKDGQSQYFHIKYSDDGETFTENNGDTLGSWIGTFVSSNPEPSLIFEDYTWKKFSEDVDNELADLQKLITEQYTDIIQESQKIALQAVEGYTKITSFEELRDYTYAQLELQAKELGIKFTESIERLAVVNGELQSQINEITKNFVFDINGMTIGQSESPFKVVVDNDRIVMLINDNEALLLDPDGNSLIPHLKVTQSKNEFGYVTTKDNRGRVIETYVGEDE